MPTKYIFYGRPAVCFFPFVIFFQKSINYYSGCVCVCIPQNTCRALGCVRELRIFLKNTVRLNLVLRAWQRPERSLSPEGGFG